MSRSADAIINPDLLKWGRETIGYDLDEAAKKIGVAPEKLADWEGEDEGETARPTVKQLFKIANVYKRPFAAFYFPQPPTQWDEPYDKLEDWRTLPDTESAKKSPGLVLELREAARRREILFDLTEEIDEEISRFDIVHKPDESPADLAQRVRGLLRVSVEDQKSCRTFGGALRMWRLAVESLGILVFQTGFFNRFAVEVEEMRGVALHFDKLPIIIINSRDSETGRIFTIMHELGHLILRQSGLSNFKEFDSPVTDEVFCNAFAGELLVPADNLKSESSVRLKTSLIWEDGELLRLANQYKVSKEMILRRLLYIRRTSHEHYSEMRAQWQKEWEERQQTSAKTGGGPKFHTKFVRCHGTRIVSTVLDAYDQDAIHSSQLSEYLDTKLKHIENIRDDLARVLA